MRLLRFILKGKSDTSLARAISAMTLFFIWYDFLGDVVICASYSTTINKLKVYVMILKQVTASFFKILAWYSILFIWFGLGFYILFHQKLKGTMEDNNENNEVAFNSK